MGSSDRFTPREQRGIPSYIADRRIVFCIAYFGYAFAYIVRNNFRLTSATIAEELGLSPIDIGFILAAFTVSYGIGKVVMGIVVDRTSMRGMLAASLFVSALVCVAIPFAHGVAQFSILLATLGIVQGGGSPASLAMINFWYPNASRGTAVSVWNTSQNLGAAMLAVFASFVIERLSGDWKLIFWVPALVSFAVSWLVWRYGKDRPWQSGYPTLTEMYGRGGIPALRTSRQHTYWRLLATALVSSPALLILIALNALLYFIRFGLINWMGLYLSGDKGISTHAAAQAFGVFEFAAIPTVLVFALLAWRWPARMSIVGMFSMLALALALLVYTTTTILDEVLPLAAVLGGLVYAPQIIVNILTLNLSPPRIVGAAIGVVGFSGYLIGEVLANLLLPRLAESAEWDSVYLLLAGCAVGALVLYAFLQPHERRAVLLD